MCVYILTHTFTLTVILISDVIYSSVSNLNPYHSLFTYQNTKSFFPLSLVRPLFRTILFERYDVSAPQGVEFRLFHT